MEGISRVFDHVKGSCALGYKLLLLAYFDGYSTIPVDCSIHREKGSKKNYGLTDRQRKEMYSKKRSEEHRGRKKENKQYLRLGGYQGRDFDGQIADCTLCFITHIVLSLDKRFSDYETMGVSPDQLLENLMADNKRAQGYYVMLETLQQCENKDVIQ